MISQQHKLKTNQDSVKNTVEFRPGICWWLTSQIKGLKRLLQITQIQETWPKVSCPLMFTSDTIGLTFTWYSTSPLITTLSISPKRTCQTPNKMFQVLLLHKTRHPVLTDVLDCRVVWKEFVLQIIIRLVVKEFQHQKTYLNHTLNCQQLPLHLFWNPNILMMRVSLRYTLPSEHISS